MKRNYKIYDCAIGYKRNRSSQVQERVETMADDGIATDGLPKTLPQENIPDTEENNYTMPREKKENASYEEPKVIYNTRALLKSAETYELETFEKNVMIIFNHVTIAGYALPRSGTKEDEKALMETFGKLGFEFESHTDLTKKDLFEELEKFMKRDFTDYGCVVVVVMTHGSHNGVLMAKDREYSEMEILNQFRTHDKPTLVTKPKLLLVQACRGTNSLNGVSVHLPEKYIRKDNGIENESYFLPAEADILVFHSTYYGNPALRDEAKGSWFIQILCENVKSWSDELDFLSIAVKVQREIAVEKCYRAYNREICDYEYNKQMPMMTSSLTRKLYFKKYQEPGNRDSVCESESQDVADHPRKAFHDYIPCKCYLKHFEYIKNYLVHYVADNPDDSQAMNYLNIAKSFKNIEHFDNTKQITLHAICKHLKAMKGDCETLKHVYLYEGDEFSNMLS